MKIIRYFCLRDEAIEAIVQLCIIRAQIRGLYTINTGVSWQHFYAIPPRNYLELTRSPKPHPRKGSSFVNTTTRFLARFIRAHLSLKKVTSRVRGEDKLSIRFQHAHPQHCSRPRIRFIAPAAQQHFRFRAPFDSIPARDRIVRSHRVQASMIGSNRVQRFKDHCIQTSAFGHNQQDHMPIQSHQIS